MFELIAFIFLLFIVTQSANVFLIDAQTCEDHRASAEGTFEKFEFHGKIPPEWQVNGALTSQDFQVSVTQCLSCGEPMLRCLARKTIDGHFCSCSEELALESAPQDTYRAIRHALRRYKIQQRKHAKRFTS